jgi:hypothetical protein
MLMRCFGSGFVCPMRSNVLWSFVMRKFIPLREWSTDRLLAVFHDLWISDNDRKLLAKIYDELERRRH